MKKLHQKEIFLHSLSLFLFLSPLNSLLELLLRTLSKNSSFSFGVCLCHCVCIIDPCSHLVTTIFLSFLVCLSTLGKRGRKRSDDKSAQKRGKLFEGKERERKRVLRKRAKKKKEKITNQRKPKWSVISLELVFYNSSRTV